MLDLSTVKDSEQSAMLNINIYIEVHQPIARDCAETYIHVPRSYPRDTQSRCSWFESRFRSILFCYIGTQT